MLQNILFRYYKLRGSQTALDYIFEIVSCSRDRHVYVVGIGRGG